MTTYTNPTAADANRPTCTNYRKCCRLCGAYDPETESCGGNPRPGDADTCHEYKEATE